jgi:CRP-like cAMP-binding protein
MTRSPRTIAARRARENAAAFAEREAKLLTLAEKFFTLEASSPAAKIEDKIETLENELTALREKLVSAQAETQQHLAAPVAEMKALKVSKDEIAARLGITRAEVNALLRAAAAKAEPEGERV